jgi:hypothetical protein
MRAKDITGQQFGRLTALYPTGERRNGTIVWRLRCIEGIEIETIVASLISGKTRSCGCLQKEIASKYNSKNITGQQFGRLTALYRPEKSATAIISSGAAAALREMKSTSR